MQNGKLFYNDDGRILENRNEEIARQAWIRKDFQVDLIDPRESFLSIFVYEYKGNGHSLQIMVNDVMFTLNPEPLVQGHFSWRTVSLPIGAAKTGFNQIEFSSVNLSFHSWIIAVDNGSVGDTSAKSYDQGKSWSSDHLGYDYSLRGEYIIRWYIEENPQYEVLQTIPRQVVQPLDHPDLPLYRKLESLQSICEGVDGDFEIATRLCSWAAGQWVHCNGLIYPPLHFSTLLDWKRKGEGHGSSDIRGFCVLFANLFIQACWSMGIYARGIALAQYSDAIPGSGHYVAEAYCTELGKWVMFDADFDLHVISDKVPLNVGEITKQWENGTINGLEIVKGPSFGQNPTGFDFFHNHLHQGGYRSIAIPRYQDYVSRPDRQMVSHGAINALDYHEPGLIIYDRSLKYSKMFPYVTDKMALLYYDPTS